MTFSRCSYYFWTQKKHYFPICGILHWSNDFNKISHFSVFLVIFHVFCLKKIILVITWWCGAAFWFTIAFWCILSISESKIFQKTLDFFFLDLSIFLVAQISSKKSSFLGPSISQAPPFCIRFIFHDLLMMLQAANNVNVTEAKIEKSQKKNSSELWNFFLMVFSR